MVEYRLLLFLAMDQILWHFENLTNGCQWENPKMCNILNSLILEWKSWNSWSYVLHILGTFHVWFCEFSVGSFSTPCKFPMFRFSKGYSSPSFYSVSTKLMESIVIMWEDRLLLFLAICQILNFLWHFEIFVNTGPHGLEISKCYSNNFHPIWGKLYEDIGLEYRVLLIVAIG